MCFVLLLNKRHLFSSIRLFFLLFCEQDRLNAIEEARRAEADARRAEATAAADPRENVRSFLSTFEADRARIDSAVADERTAHAAGKSADDLRAALEGLQTEVLQMERRVAEASYFLPPYDSRASTATVEVLKTSVATAIAELLPRKKFSFSKKKKATTAAAAMATVGAVEPPTVSAVAGNGDDAARAATAAASAAAKVAAAASAANDGPGLRRLTGGVHVVGADSLERAAAGTTADYVLEDLTDCTVFLLGTLRALRCHNLTRVKVYVGPVAGSVHAQGIYDCVLQLAARQVRIHNATEGTQFYIRTLSRPIIEHSSDVKFAPYTFEYPGSAAAMEAAGLGNDPGMWNQVDDFGWIKQHQSPNWRVIPEAERTAPPEAPPVSDAQ